MHKLKLCHRGAGLVVGGACLGRRPEAGVEERCRWEDRSWGNGGLSRDPWAGFNPTIPDSPPRPPSWACSALSGYLFWPRRVAVVPVKLAREWHAPLPALTPLFVVFPARTISTCPSTSRPASCSVGRGVPVNPSFRGSPGPLHPGLNNWES